MNRPFVHPFQNAAAPPQQKFDSINNKTKRGVGGRMHSCREDPRVFIEDDEDKIQKLLEVYSTKPARALGVVDQFRSFARVFALYRKGKNPIDAFAVKVMNFEDRFLQEKGRIEIRIACMLNTIRKETPIFVYTLGYFICQGLLDEKEEEHNNLEITCAWRKELPHTIRNESRFIHMFMHKPEFGFLSTDGGEDSENVNYNVRGFTLDYVISLLFILFHGIYIARKRLGFMHGDIHAGNLMFTLTPGHVNTHFNLMVSKIQHNVSFISGFTPKVIDFGYSKAGLKISHEQQDLEYFVETLMKHKEVSALFDLNAYFRTNNKKEWKPEYQKLFQSANNDPESIERFLLDDPLFQNVSSIEKARPQKHRLVETCVVCGKHDAAFRFQDTAAGLCSPFCSHRIGPLAHFLPREDFIQ